MATGRLSTPVSADSGLACESCFSSPLSPSRRSRLQEKEELRQLNDRLALYIERVRALEAAKAALHLRLAEYEEGSRRTVGVLRRSYDSELSAARRVLDDQALQRAALQVELDKLREEHRQLLARNSKKEVDLSLAVARARDLDAQLHSKAAELATSLSRQQSLENDLQESKYQIISLKKMVSDSKTHLQNETLRRTDVESQMKTLKEQVTFLKNLHEDELKNKKRFYESRIQETESGRQQEYESKLLNALKELRKEHEQQIQEYKHQIEQNFSAKMENIQLSAAKNSDIANSAQEELRKTKLRVDTLMSQNATVEARIRELEARIRDLEKTIVYERDSSKRCIAEKDREMAEMQQQMEARLEDYEHLLDMKLALDLEISAYRAMLEGEEKRLKLSRPSSESVGMQATINQGCSHFLQGKKRRRTLAKQRAHSMSFKVVQHASSSGSVSIEDIDTEGKFIKIKNNSDKDLSLTGWMVRRHYRNESDIMYQFPARFTLRADQVVTIWSAIESSSPGPGALVWRSPKSWGVGENITIVLLDADGKETAEGKITYVDRGEGDGEMEDAAGQEEVELHSQQNESRSCPIM
ncbi:lamin-L(III)-like isoform X1 [Rhineura floridana]|uniref:lamin-L(III)-like isoform X1 n=1 Tax=Rhineura floridana TaxID=261503 RepID=UPI002AC88492|nr:lamin-L(III)-like isoform X1 [Rhineura floridana]